MTIHSTGYRPGGFRQGFRSGVTRHRGTGAAGDYQMTVIRAARDLDALYFQNGCAGCEDFGSDLRVRTLAFKVACLLDPSVRDLVALNVSTPLAQSGFGPGTDAALTLVLGATRQSTGYCTDDAGNCIKGKLQPPLPPELQAVSSALGAQAAQLINLFVASPQANQNDAGTAAIVAQLTTLYKAFAEQVRTALQALINNTVTATTPNGTPAPPSVLVVPVVPAKPSVTAAMPAMSHTGMILGVAAIAVAALGTGAIIMTYAKKKKGARK